MTIEKFCLKCLHEIFYDTTEHHWCCECFAVRTILDEDDMPSLEHVPNHWIETEQISRLYKLFEVCRQYGTQLPKEVFDAMVASQYPPPSRFVGVLVGIEPPSPNS